MAMSLRSQTKEAMVSWIKPFGALLAVLASRDSILERYDRIRDFTKEIALVPVSAKEGEGIQDLLAVVIGLAERYLTDQLADISGAGEGTVLEMKEERGLGKTLDVILHRGSISKGDEIVLVTTDGGTTTTVRGLFKPRGMSEMRDAGDRWNDTETARAASGLSLSTRFGWSFSWNNPEGS